ncbi:MAG: DinB family protein [Acidobacteria bacterium]|nr:DinB family protein [Acidobacteriota bacterium]
MQVAARIREIVEQREPWLRALPPHQLTRREPDRWSAKQILGHLIDSASNNHQRFVRAQLADSLTSPGYEQISWNRVQAYHDAPWPVLAALWANYNLHLAHIIERITPEHAGKLVTVGDRTPITLAALVEDYLRHLEHHLRQLDQHLDCGT